MSDGLEMKRVPIALGSHAIALITLFKLPHDHIEDMWAWDWIAEEGRDKHKRSAKQFIEAMEGHWSPAFLMSLRDQITETLVAHDNECGTSFASRSKESSHG